jgi:hypothetical protein
MSLNAYLQDFVLDPEMFAFPAKFVREKFKWRFLDTFFPEMFTSHELKKGPMAVTDILI